MCKCVQVCKGVREGVRLYVCVHVRHIQIVYTYTQSYIHTFIHTHMQYINIYTYIHYNKDAIIVLCVCVCVCVCVRERERERERERVTTWRARSVAMYQGETQLTRMLSFAHSQAKFLVSMSIAALVAA